jgi:hypothetical protein
VKLKATHQKELVLQDYYSEPSAILRQDLINFCPVPHNRIPWGSSKHLYSVTKGRFGYDGYTSPSDHGYGFKGKLNLSDDGKKLAKAEITVTDYLGDLISSLPASSLMNNSSKHPITRVVPLIIGTNKESKS